MNEGSKTCHRRYASPAVQRRGFTEANDGPTDRQAIVARHPTPPRRGDYVHQVIATPFLDEGFLVLKPGSENGMRIPAGHYQQLRDLSARNETAPDWLIKAAADRWGLPLRSRPVRRSSSSGNRPTTVTAERRGS